MASSIFDPEVQAVLDAARSGGGNLFASPADWRDLPIYFLMVDRFNNDAGPPRHMPFDAPFTAFQGGGFAGVQSRLRYIKAMGFGSLWLSPVLKNPPFDTSAYHGYGIQNFLAAEPRFASSAANADTELRQLVDEAHRLGLYVIFDIVLHHAGNVFAYAAQGGGFLDSLPWQSSTPPIAWRDALGRPDPAASQAPSNPPLDAAVWPTELRSNLLFTRRGNANSLGGQRQGDFDSLKGIDFATAGQGEPLAYQVLIRAYQYVMAKFDVDAFRIDTLKYLEPDFERVFANAMREFALSAGKKNFFTFGEVYDSEREIAQFVGRNTNAVDAPVGVDAALDYPLFYKLPGMAKGLGIAPADVAQVFEARKTAEADILTSHGEAGKYFVTFLDNHDQPQRFGFTGPTQKLGQIALGLMVLYALPGIPCVYYGTEQGLQGHKTPTLTDDSMVREALWGKPSATGAPSFDPTHPLYVFLAALGAVRAAQPALRYGRYYFRPLSGDLANFGLSSLSPGVFAVSRILNDQEVVIVANIDPQTPFAGQVVVDATINRAGPTYRILLSTQGTVGTTGPAVTHPGGTVRVTEVDGTQSNGPIVALPLNLQAGEAQILAI